MAIKKSEAPNEKDFERFLKNFTYIYPTGWVTKKSLAKIYIQIKKA